MKISKNNYKNKIEERDERFLKDPLKRYRKACFKAIDGTKSSGDLEETLSELPDHIRVALTEIVERYQTTITALNTHFRKYSGAVTREIAQAFLKNTEMNIEALEQSEMRFKDRRIPKLEQARKDRLTSRSDVKEILPILSEETKDWALALVKDETIENLRLAVPEEELELDRDLFIELIENEKDERFLLKESVRKDKEKGRYERKKHNWNSRQLHLLPANS